MPADSRPLAWEDDFSRNSLDFSPLTEPIDIASLSIKRMEGLFQQYVPFPYLQMVNLQEAFEKDNFPLPGDDDREGYSVGQHEWFWLSGLVDWLKIRQALQKYDMQPKRIMEIGAASGRVLRHLSVQGKFPEIWASDLNHRHVRWISQFLDPSIRCIHNHVFPHLPIADNRLDFLCAFSVFTHIDTFETAWIAEANRILSPGGIAYLTFHTEHTWEAMKNLESYDHRLLVMRKTKWFRDEMVNQPMPGERLTFRHTQIGPYRGLGFHHTDLIRENWGRFFEILDIIPMHHGMDQTVVILRKSPNG